MKLLVSWSAINYSELHDRLVQKWCIDLLNEGKMILMWDEQEFDVCGDSCHHEVVHHLIALMGPCFFVCSSIEHLTFNIEFF